MTNQTPRFTLDLHGSAGDSTARVQAALNKARLGPLRLVLHGTHHCAALQLFSDTHLVLADDAVLQFRPGYAHYERGTVAVMAEDSDRAMIRAKGAERISVSGKGRILCDGATAYSSGDDEIMGTRIPLRERPRVMVLDGCRDVRIEGITVQDSPMWTLHFVNCEHVRLKALTIQNDLRMPNTDGVVIDGCRDVRICGCEIRTADDGIVLKTSFRIGGGVAGECADIHVSGCVIESRSCALKVGTESAAAFRNIRFESCRIEGSNRALGIFSRDGGVVEGVRFADMRLVCSETPDGFWGSGEPVTITALDRRPELPAGAVRDVSITNITGSAPGAINLYAERTGLISDVTISAIALDQSPGPLGTSARYDIRPTPADLAPSPDAAGRKNAWRLGEDGRVIGLIEYPGGVPSVFARNVEGLSLSGLSITRPDPLPEGWAVDPVTIV